MGALPVGALEAGGLALAVAALLVAALLVAALLVAALLVAAALLVVVAVLPVVAAGFLAVRIMSSMPEGLLVAGFLPRPDMRAYTPRAERVRTRQRVRDGVLSADDSRADMDLTSWTPTQAIMGE